ncbi:MAG: trypsin-like peptidase domain-containing protein [Proteobacteria bacterium]|nr:trypsin-like peptidase domain-containing protein [Pseudomonadota bacterium]
MTARLAVSLLLAACVACAPAARGAGHPPAETPVAAAPLPPAGPVSAAAEAVYAKVRPAVLQVRTLVDAAGRQSTLGSGFVVSADGVAVTNYHVVSRAALEPATYRLEYLASDGTRGALKLLAFDVIHDLAVVKLERPATAWLAFAAPEGGDTPAKGERLFAVGNPLDLGFAIVEGTYNGLVDKSYNEQIHFTGALNPGMSGGPTVTAAGRVAGVNVSKQVGGELVSFLVPAHYAADLVARATVAAPRKAADTRAEIARQLTAFQAEFYAAVADKAFRPAKFGPYVAPESNATWFDCWASTNGDDLPPPRARADTTRCRTRTSIFVNDEMTTGSLELSHTHLRSVDLNAIQFASRLSMVAGAAAGGVSGSRKLYTSTQCRADFVAAHDSARTPLRVSWCARAYRDFPGLYDVWLTAVTQDRSDEALVSRIAMRGVTYANALKLGRTFLDTIGGAP